MKLQVDSNFKQPKMKLQVVFNFKRVLLLRACPFDLNINWQGWLRGEFFQEHLSQFQSNIAFLYISVVIYLVWRERNDRIHGKSSKQVIHILESIKRMVREKLFTCEAFRKQFVRDPTLSQILY